MSDKVYKYTKELFYITHINNLPSILEKGILCHQEIINQNLEPQTVYDSNIISLRQGKSLPNNKKLWDYANMYFQVRNPMLYRVTRESKIDEIAVLSIDKSILKLSDIYVSDGNAAHSHSSFFESTSMDSIHETLKDIQKMEYWDESGKRKIMAEALVPSHVPPQYIKAIYTPSEKGSELIKSKCDFHLKDIVIEPRMFFSPDYYYRVSERINLVRGDMFFSKAQTLTISVNCVGVMGKGLAARAKYQFPHVYVKYEGLCKRNIITKEKPYLINDEFFMDEKMADDPGSMKSANGLKWFLLFATKGHWKENSNLVDLEKGLQYLVEKQPEWKMKSLAVPALGCGLGGLSWSEAGPMMCKYLDQLGINIRLYLPAEQKLNDKWLTPEYLLK
jgi:O-acetyl-ADP-ribose deacetylase (regulator of RNase III)